MSINDTNVETLKHIMRIRDLANKMAFEFLGRIGEHDKSKLESPEAEGFNEITHKLKDMKFGSPEYEQCKLEAEATIQHHYRFNTHHPEHHTRGVNGMDILEILEMFIDWKAASERNKDGSLEKSIQFCCSKYEISPQLEEIFLNSMYLLDNE